MSTCWVVSCVVGRECLLWPGRSLGKTLLAFSLLPFVLQGQTCLMSQTIWKMTHHGLYEVGESEQGRNSHRGAAQLGEEGGGDMAGQESHLHSRGGNLGPGSDLLLRGEVCPRAGDSGSVRHRRVFTSGWVDWIGKCLRAMGARFLTTRDRNYKREGEEN